RAAPGSGLDTFTVSMPPETGTATPLAISCVGGARVTCHTALPTNTAALAAKPLPLMVTEDAPRTIIDGNTLVIAASAFINLIVPVSVAVGSITLFAVRVTVLLAGRVAGGVYNPVALTEPALAEYVTLLFTAFFTDTENCLVSPNRRLTLSG